MTDVPDCVYVPDGERYVPTSLARGPWGDFISGQYVGGLMAAAIERRIDDADLHPARLTVDLSARTALEPVTVRTTVRREGARLRLIDAEMIQGERTVAHARSVYLRRGEQTPNEVWSTPVEMPPMPPIPETPQDGATSHGEIFSADHPGEPGADLRIWQTTGQKFIWLTYITPLIRGEKLTPFVRAALVADSSSAMVNYGTTGLHVINADYTVTLSRLPEGPSIGVAAMTQSSDAGIASGSVLLFDGNGPIGNAVTVSIANGGFRPHTHSPE